MNPIHKKIYDIICESIDQNPKGYSTITNTEISKDMTISPFSVRDHVIVLVKRGYLQRINNHWTEQNEFHNRILFRGKHTPKSESMDSE
jgi:DNA-binding GntR family transcriptional regulator